MDTHEPTDANDALRGLWLILTIYLGPLLWPMVILNVIGYAWCLWAGWRPFLKFLTVA